MPSAPKRHSGSPVLTEGCLAQADFGGDHVSVGFEQNPEPPLDTLDIAYGETLLSGLPSVPSGHCLQTAAMSTNTVAIGAGISVSMLLRALPTADNIAKGEVVEVPGRQATELRVQLVTSPENLPKTLYNPNDMCASGCPSGTTAEAACSRGNLFLLLTWSFTAVTCLPCTQMLALWSCTWSRSHASWRSGACRNQWITMRFDKRGFQDVLLAVEQVLCQLDSKSQ